jgi:hypothetical protein
MKKLLWLSGLLFSFALLILLLAFPLDYFGIIRWSDVAMFGLLLVTAALVPAMIGGLWFLWKKLK